MSRKNDFRKIWPLPAAVVTTIVLFSVTFFIYAERIRLTGGLLPIVTIGAFLFATTMLFLTNAIISSNGRKRIVIVIAIVIGETMIFVYAMMFLILNIFGS